MPTVQKTILNIRVERNDQGVVIKLQSDIDWTPVKSPRNPDFTLCGVPCHAFMTNLMGKINESGKQHKVLVNSPDAKLMDGVNINASFLQAKNIREGVQFIIPPSAMTPSGVTILNEFKNRLKEWATDIYQQQLKSVRVKAVVTTTEYTEA